MTDFRKTLQLKACQASKGLNVTSSFIFITREITKYIATNLFNSFKNSFFFIKEIENLSKIIYFLHCIFSSISIFSVLVELREQEIINYCFALHFIF